uniref:Uncharacterized protein n=1 Tax=uncultured marine group II/III euryarchaeote AD1000_58_G05 TaxID=1457790 RepID=A0A075FV16_9EURY|nr:hypothetical protein [uncultured marine group II/III euryarchaeote AD1000_58_G05]
MNSPTSTDSRGKSPPDIYEFRAPSCWSTPSYKATFVAHAMENLAPQLVAKRNDEWLLVPF